MIIPPLGEMNILAIHGAGVKTEIGRIGPKPNEPICSFVEFLSISVST